MPIKFLFFYKVLFFNYLINNMYNLKYQFKLIMMTNYFNINLILTYKLKNNLNVYIPTTPAFLFMG